jgi:DNA-binding NarL/FixJ family response regulator
MDNLVPSRPIESTDRNSRARVLIADDHILVAQALKRLLEPEFSIVGLVHDGGSAVDEAKRLQPHVALLDISMPGLNGVDAGQQIKAFKPGIKIVYLTMAHSSDVVAEAIRRGASGYVHKCGDAEEIRIAIRLALRGKSYISPHLDKEEVMLRLRSHQKYRAEKSLTARQTEILRLIAEGRRMQEIANIVGLRYGTVSFHKYRIMELLDIKTSAGLIEYAIRQRIAGKPS